jgi:seryl-tRNA synthetase
MTEISVPTPNNLAPGIVTRDENYERLIDRLQASLTALGTEYQPTRLGVPPVISRSLLEKVGYAESFPHLLGVAYSFKGTEAHWQELAPQVANGGDGWLREHEPTDIALLPAVCYHVYPGFAGTTLSGVRTVDVCSHCYRHEETTEHGRLRSFRMREFVHVGEIAPVLERRQQWLDGTEQWLTNLGLPPKIEPANDPFFGSAARLMGPAQVKEELKLEFIVDVGSGEHKAIASSNYHKDHFGHTFEIEAAGGGPAHTSCSAFGLERIALAVIEKHGIEEGNWPI